MEKNIQTYVTEVNQYSQSQKIQSKCNAISFINTGTVNMYINKYLILPSQTLSIAGNKNEMDVTQYQLEFDTAAIAGNCTVIKKIYQ